MSHQDIKDEYKDTDGQPEVKQKIRKPAKALMLFDLSPVIKIENKKIIEKKIINFLFLEFIYRKPIIIKQKELINPPTTGSSLKKLTILS